MKITSRQAEKLYRFAYIVLRDTKNIAELPLTMQEIFAVSKLIDEIHAGQPSQKYMLEEHERILGDNK